MVENQKSSLPEVRKLNERVDESKWKDAVPIKRGDDQYFVANKTCRQKRKLKPRFNCYWVKFFGQNQYYNSKKNFLQLDVLSLLFISAFSL
ncbi:hypothetical protein RclHR1_01890005 [Rhizophagus clarus]|nr:hypothetical protein RclHR1_01890005 [Rhizophagus clarus]